MAETLGQSWFNANQERPYPLSDAATRDDDEGKFLPNNIIADLSLWYPVDLGDFAFISGVFNGPKLTSVVISVAQDQFAAPAEYTPIASVSAANASSESVYKLAPLVDGVSGIIVFGNGIRPSTAASYKFSSPSQSILLPKTSRSYSPPGVISMRRSGGSVGLRGQVKIIGLGDLEVVGEDLTVDGVPVRAAVFNLRSDTSTNLLNTYAGPCGGRPESETCPLPGIEFINSVQPDCNGNIKVTFRGGVIVTPFTDGGGVMLDYSLGLVDACTAKNQLPDSSGRLPNDYDDACAAPFDRDHYVNNDHTGENPGGGTSEVLDCSDLPYVDTFDDQSQSLPYHFWVNGGIFTWTDTPDKPIPYFDITSSSYSDGFTLNTTEDDNYLFWDDCAVYSPFDVDNSSWGKCLKIEVGFRTTSGYAQAGLILSGSTTYVTYGKESLGPQIRWGLTVNTTGEYVHLKQMLGGTLYNHASVSVPGLSAYSNEWISLSAELYRVGVNNSAVYFEVRDKIGTLIASDIFTGLNIQPGPFGIMSSHIFTGDKVEFAWFRVDPSLNGPSTGCA